jgi:hypothetical protein
MVIDITPWGEGRRGTAPGGACYLLASRRPDPAYRLFLTMIRSGHSGLVISRTHPDRLRRTWALEGVRVSWLSHTPGEDNQNPMALGGLTKLVTKFMEEQPEGVVLLDGLEYLVTNNGFQQVLLFLEGINEFVMARNNILLVPVSPAALEVREMALLERSLQPLQEAEGPERETLAGRVTVEDVINLLEKY